MIIEGVKLMVIGMAIVYVFLIVLMFSVMLSARLFKDSGAGASAGPVTPVKSRRNVTPVIAAAVKAYRTKRAGDSSS
ncbi:MAG: OadG family protein [Candidatus Dadabacteria bacterium]|nr:OadG family protein [Candidatus Dadabacteria bacterium]MCY4261822.1 OadG family protein [Candidatus Dadabacteria bacterium]